VQKEELIGHQSTLHTITKNEHNGITFLDPISVWYQNMGTALSLRSQKSGLLTSKTMPQINPVLTS